MPADRTARRRMTAAEYLTFEREAETKHELIDGEMYAMAGASLTHNAVVANLVRVLGNALAHGPCRPLPSDMRVKSQATGDYTYPDVTVLCGQAELEDDRQDTLLNPAVVFEVLSESTERYDRGRKFEHYRSIESVREYVLVSQDKPLVEQYTRQADGTWVLRALRGGDTLRLGTVDCEIAVDDVYARVFGAPAGET